MEQKLHVFLYTRERFFVYMRPVCTALPGDLNYQLFRCIQKNVRKYTKKREVFVPLRRMYSRKREMYLFTSPYRKNRVQITRFFPY